MRNDRKTRVYLIYANHIGKMKSLIFHNSRSPLTKDPVKFYAVKNLFGRFDDRTVNSLANGDKIVTISGFSQRFIAPKLLQFDDSNGRDETMRERIVLVLVVVSEIFKLITLSVVNRSETAFTQIPGFF